MRGNDPRSGGRRRLSPAHPLARPARPGDVQPSPAPPASKTGMADVPVPHGPRLDGEGRPYITLAQFLKHHDLAPTGGAAKHLARSGTVTVNGAAEDRPGRKLHVGDRVAVDGCELIVALP